MTSSRRLFDAIGAQLVLHRQFGDDPPRVGADYAIDEILGAGGFGLICGATQLALRRRVALKLFALGDAGAREALREARSLARLDHPNIVRVYAAGEAELIAGERIPCAFVEMQRIDGVTLRTWIDARAPTGDSVLAVLIQAGRALAHAHAAGVLHRDFKPENLLIDREGRPTVIDFGLALVAEDGGAEDPALARWTPGADALGTRATGTGLVRGTPGYMAPEAAIGRPRAGSDQFALAVVVREALTGRHPFDVDGASQTVPAGGPALFARIKPALDRAMAPSPEDRYPSLAALCDDLATLAAPVAPPRPRRWRAAALAGGGIAGVAVAGWLGLAGLDRPTAPELGDQPGPTATAPEPSEPPGRSEPARVVADPPAREPSPAQPEPREAAMAPAVGCEDLEAWAGTWQATTRVTWTEYAFQHDWRVDYELALAIGERCSVTVTARKYPVMVPGELPGTPVETTATAVALREASGVWRLPLRLRFPGDTRTYAAEEFYETVLLLDRASAESGAQPGAQPATPRLRGAYRKRNDDGRWIRLGLLAAERGVAPDPRTITQDDLACAARCHIACAGTIAEDDCYQRGCAPFGPDTDPDADPNADPNDPCGPPSYDFKPPMRATAARESLRAGNNPFAQALERGNKPKQLADCARNAATLAGRWGLWLGDRRVDLDLRADGCELAGIIRTPTADAASPALYTLAGYVTAAGTWVLQPAPGGPAWLSSALVLVGVGERGPAFGTDTADTPTLLRAYRQDRP